MEETSLSTSSSESCCVLFLGRLANSVRRWKGHLAPWEKAIRMHYTFFNVCTVSNEIPRGELRGLSKNLLSFFWCFARQYDLFTSTAHMAIQADTKWELTAAVRRANAEVECAVAAGAARVVLWFVFQHHAISGGCRSIVGIGSAGGERIQLGAMSALRDKMECAILNRDFAALENAVENELHLQCCGIDCVMPPCNLTCPVLCGPLLTGITCPKSGSSPSALSLHPQYAMQIEECHKLRELCVTKDYNLFGIRFFGCTPPLTTLILDETGVTTDDLALFASAHLPQLKILSLQNMRLKNFAPVAECFNLTNLDVSRNEHLTDDQLSLIVKQLKSLAVLVCEKCPHIIEGAFCVSCSKSLKKLNFRDTMIGRDPNALVSLFCGAVGAFIMPLQELALNPMQIRYNFEYIRSATSLLRLDLSDSSIGTDALHHIVTAPLLEEMDLQRCASLSALSPFSKRPPCVSTITSLKLDSTHTTNECLHSIAFFFPRLCVLHLASCKDVTDFTPLAAGAPPLRDLNLRETSVNDSTMELIAPALKFLRILNVRGCSNLVNFASWVGKCSRRLVNLDCSSTYFDQSAVEAMVDANYHELRELCLRCCGVKDISPLDQFRPLLHVDFWHS